MSLLTTLLNTPTVPYVVGSKSPGLPVNVNLSIDQDFKKVVYKTAGIFAAGIALGIFAGVIYNKRKGK